MLHSLVHFVNLTRAVAGGKKVVTKLQKRDGYGKWSEILRVDCTYYQERNVESLIGDAQQGSFAITSMAGFFASVFQWISGCVPMTWSKNHLRIIVCTGCSSPDRLR